MRNKLNESVADFITSTFGCLWLAMLLSLVAMLCGAPGGVFPAVFFTICVPVLMFKCDFHF